MVAPVSHIIIALLIYYVIQRKINYLKDKNYYYLPFIISLFAVMPDFDYIFKISADLFNFTIPDYLIHRSIMHTPFFAFVLFLIGLVLYYKKQQNYSVIFFAGSIAYFSHILLDLIFSKGIEYGAMMLLLPFSFQRIPIVLFNFMTHLPALFFIGMDGILLLASIWYLTIVKKKKSAGGLSMSLS